MTDGIKRRAESVLWWCVVTEAEADVTAAARLRKKDAERRGKAALACRMWHAVWTAQLATKKACGALFGLATAVRYTEEGGTEDDHVLIAGALAMKWVKRERAALAEAVAALRAVMGDDGGEG